MYELTVILKDDERTYRQKFLCYEPCMLKIDDPYIQSLIKEAQASLKCEPDEVSISIKMEC